MLVGVCRKLTNLHFFLKKKRRRQGNRTSLPLFFFPVCVFCVSGADARERRAYFLFTY